MKQDLLKWRINTYVGDGICFSELVDCDIEDGHDEDEGPVCEVYKKPRRTPDWTGKLYSSRSQRSKEVGQVEPEFQSPRGVEDVEEVGHLKTSSWPMHLRKATLLLSLVSPSRPRLLQTATTPSARLGAIIL